MMTKASILYVDDEADNLLSFRAIFRREYQVHTAQSGQEGLALLEQEAIDLVISDQRMPEMTGVEFLEQVRLRFPEPIRMVLTGYSDVQAIIDAINKGKVQHYLTKPWNVPELKQVIANALEAIYLRRQNKVLIEEKNALELKNAQQAKENILAQYEILKNQVNPHFLFNSMNILSSLISINPEKAIAFTRHFSKLYRKLLELSNQQIISLEQELEFIHSYIFLQKMRFDENLQIEMAIDEEQLKSSLPPFSLQLLVENAVKHNIISIDNPLKVHIYTDKHYIRVANQLQPRGGQDQVASTHIGLKN
ncbi:MAG: histidine kinase, partial [Bacteroidota bacterium]